MPLSTLALANSEPRIDHEMVAQVRQLESVRPGLFRHLIGVFDTNTTALFKEIPERIANNEMESLRISFHSLKGTAASLGAQRFSFIADIAERAAQSNASAQSLELIFKHLSDEFEATRIALQQAALDQ